VRWQLVEPAVMAVQLGRLASLSELPNIRLGVIPLDTRSPTAHSSPSRCMTTASPAPRPSAASS
jgi:hypothetical protein